MSKDVTVKVMPCERGPVGKLADVELQFSSGLLAGLKLVGFAVWERRGGSGFNVTFPARQYSVNGMNRSFVLLRPTGEDSPDTVRDFILAAYHAHVQGVVDAAGGSVDPDGFRWAPSTAVPAVDPAPAAHVAPAEFDAAATEARARVLWASLDASEQHGVKFGLFPAGKMLAAEAEGYKGHALSVALMRIASEASPARVAPASVRGGAAGSKVGALNF